MKAIAILVAFVAVAISAANGMDSVRLAAGETVSGVLEVQQGGVFQWQEHGGRLMNWEELEPASLPAALRERVRRQALGWLSRADRLYRSGQVELAARGFDAVYGLRGYLTEADRGSAAYRDIGEKRHGRVFHEGFWMPFSTQQRMLGRVRYRGKWLARETAEEYRAFDLAMARSARSQDYGQAALELLTVVKRYPDSDRAEAARARVDALIALMNRREATRTGAEREERAVAAKEPAREVHVHHHTSTPSSIYSVGYPGTWWPAPIYTSHPGRHRGHHKRGGQAAAEKRSEALDRDDSWAAGRYNYNQTYPFTNPNRVVGGDSGAGSGSRYSVIHRRSSSRRGYVAPPAFRGHRRSSGVQLHIRF